MPEGLGRTIRMFLVEGKPTGLINAEVINWTGQVLTGPRSSLVAVLGREEARRPGIYFLLDEAAEAALPTLYIGESDNVAGRIKAHDGQREFGRVAIVTSKDANLTKAHVLYLESRMIELREGIGRVIVANGRASEIRSLPESDRADMEYFVQQLELVLPVIGFDVLRPTRQRIRAKRESAVPESEGLQLVLSPTKHPDLAKAIEDDGEFTVLAGSRALAEGRTVNDYAALREQLIADGRMAPMSGNPAYLIFKHDVPFKSASAASSVILNRNSNGRVEWKLSDGQSLKEYQETQLKLVSVPGAD